MFESSAWTRGACGERRQASRRLFLMRRPWLAVLAVAITFAWPTHSRADFMWMGNWNVGLIDVTGGAASGQATFGDVTANLANAGGSLAASSDPMTPNSGGFVMATFERQFMLFNDPNDSLVTLFGTLSGALNATSAAPGITASASGTGSAQIVDSLGFIRPSIFGVDAVVAQNDTDDTFVLMSLLDSAILSDGVYTISGALELEMRVNQGPVGIADANANLNFIVGVSAQTIPEPPTFLLVSSGVFVLLVWLGRQRTRSAKEERRHESL